MNIRPTTTVSASIWKAFIREVGKTKGVGKGVIKESLEEALQAWIEDGKRKRETV